MKYLLLLLLLFSNLAVANVSTLNLKYGVGLDRAADSQFVSLGWQKNFYYGFAHQLECGGWLDQRPGNSGSLFCSASLGLRVIVPYIYAESMHGIGAISDIDSLLGGNFEFFHDTGIGIHDGKNNYIGILLKHISNAGLSKPNIGRNYLSIKLGFDF